MTENQRKPGPHMLSGVRILDLGTMVAGPQSATLFGDFGADVIKVEVPERGDTVRDIGPFVDGECLYWEVENRNKRSITLNLREKEGQDILCKLVSQCDAVVENFRPGTLEKWGLTFEALKKHNPKLVLLRVSGFGQTGPYSSRAGYDRIGLAFGGLMGITGYPDRPPVRIGTSTADYQTAILGAFSLMMALYHRDCLGGEGQEIDLAMYEAVIRFTEVLVPEYDRMGYVRGPRGNIHFAAAPGDHFPMQDGSYVIVTCSAQTGWERLCAAMDRLDLLEDPRMATHELRWQYIKELNKEVADFVMSMPPEQVFAKLDEAKAAYAPILTIDKIMQNEHYKARNTIVSVENPRIGPVRMTGVVPKIPGIAEKPIAPAPALGEHNAEVYGELLGLTEADLAALQQKGTI